MNSPSFGEQGPLKTEVSVGALKGLVGTVQSLSSGRAFFRPDGLAGVAVLISPRALRKLDEADFE